VRLYLNGAFYNGTALDSSALLVMGYERAQRAVVEMLSTEGRAGWGHDKVVDPSGLRFSVTGKYPTLIPVSFASKTGEAVVERVRCVIAEFSATYSDVAEVEVDEADIDFFDFGVGVLAIKLSVIPRATLCIGELRALAENLSTALVKPLNELVANAVEEFDNAVKRSLPVTQLHASSWLQDDGYLVAVIPSGVPPSLACFGFTELSFSDLKLAPRSKSMLRNCFPAFVSMTNRKICCLSLVSGPVPF
jgi:hypothetical protein